MIHVLFFLAILAGSSVHVKDMNFTASTPACKIVKDFLGINRADLIDFIRWRLAVSEGKKFELFCSYGIAKANTNGFLNEQKLQINGQARFDDGVITLSNEGKTLSMLLLNGNILHLLNSNGALLVGNGGWSYTLNSTTPVEVAGFNLKAGNVSFTDSIVFDGRTPCKGIEELMENRTRAECYKKKWRVSLYKNGPDAFFGTYMIGGPVEARTGKWKLKDHFTGTPVYSLDLNNGNTLDLFAADENIVYIMDGKGGLMVGDHDFSYSLNRKGKMEL